mmetsp:Transcript_123308/g.310378  ORF Transcript_123308/g.310378 Transcript_123308/m.310378 type:complete len:96 (-) Transcript_123308:60-347(-)
MWMDLNMVPSGLQFSQVALYQRARSPPMLQVLPPTELDSASGVAVASAYLSGNPRSAGACSAVEGWTQTSPAGVARASAVGISRGILPGGGAYCA